MGISWLRHGCVVVSDHCVIGVLGGRACCCHAAHQWISIVQEFQSCRNHLWHWQQRTCTWAPKTTTPQQLPPTHPPSHTEANPNHPPDTLRAAARHLSQPPWNLPLQSAAAAARRPTGQRQQRHPLLVTTQWSQATRVSALIQMPGSLLALAGRLLRRLSRSTSGFRGCCSCRSQRPWMSSSCRPRCPRRPFGCDICRWAA